MIENLLDVAHLGFVHAGLLGDPQRGEVEDYEVTAGSETRGPEARQIRIWQPDPDGTGSSALVNYHYWVHGPLTAGFIKSHGQHRFGMLAQVAPIDEDTCESRLIMSLNYGSDIAEDELHSLPGSGHGAGSHCRRIAATRIAPTGSAVGTASSVGPHGDCLSQMASCHRAAIRNASARP